MQFIDLNIQKERIQARLDQNLQAVFQHGQYIMGQEIRSLEERLAAYVGVRHAISCSSGTDALLMALMAQGVGPGDAVFTTPFTFIATAEVIGLLGAVPVFVDIDPRTYNIDPERLAKAIEAASSGSPSEHPLPHVQNRTALQPKGIISVGLFGLPADYGRIDELARARGLFLIEDAAQSFGGEYPGRKSCSLGDIGCTSFFPAKPLGCYGDGGMCFTNDDGFADAMRSVRVHGQGSHKYDNDRIGINGRMDTIQAAVLHAKFDIFPEELELRQKIAGTYTELISGLNLGLVTPTFPHGYKSAWAQYSILAPNAEHRSQLQENLKQKGIPTAVYYPKPLHLQRAFSYLNYREGDFPISEDCSKRIFSIPMHPYLSRDDQKKVVQAMAEVRSH